MGHDHNTVMLSMKKLSTGHLVNIDENKNYKKLKDLIKKKNITSNKTTR